MKKTTLFLGFITTVIVALFFLAGCGEKKREVAKEKAFEPNCINLPSKAKMNIDLSYMEDIKKSRELLQEIEAGYETKTEKRFTFESKKVVAKNAKHGKKGKHVKQSRKVKREWCVTRLKSFNVAMMVENVEKKTIQCVKILPKNDSDPKGYKIIYDRASGISGEPEITYPEGYVVLTLRRAIYWGKEIEEAIYSPYSKEFDSPVFRRKGYRYFLDILKKAKADLTDKGVKSQAFKGMLVADTVSTDLAMTLATIEHVDPKYFEKDKADYKKLSPGELVNKVLVLIALNEKNAFHFSISKDGARDLFQFIPKTYAGIVAQYPVAGLDKDFKRGMSNHVNAAKASMLLLDSDLRFLSGKQKEIAGKNEKAKGEFLAASYNHGAPRIKQAMIKYGNLWKNHIPQETQTYIKKYNAVWDELHKK
jgi:hypothetical protein